MLEFGREGANDENKNYNVLQFWEDNNLKQCIDNGLIPLSEKEIEELGDIF